jgi:hypothetical protein
MTMKRRQLPKLVTPGLDPGVHANHAPSGGAMDPRIKSAGDELQL